jgi:molybdopterin-guanine dinucleotide biosynthesis protein A
MGIDKARLLHPQGGTFLTNAIRQLAPLCSLVALAGRIESQVPFALLNSAIDPRRALYLPDPMPHTGPLAGLISALQSAQEQSYLGVLVIPIDMPNLTTEHLRCLVTLFENSSGLPIAATFDNQRPEPLVAIYPTSVLEPLVELNRSEHRSLSRWLMQAGCQLCLLPLSCAPNVNTPQDLQHGFQQHS